MAIKSGSLDYWRTYFRTANSDIFEIIDHAILVAASDCPKDFRLRRDRIAELLFSCGLNRCLGCDRVELALPGDDDGGGKDGCEFEAGGSKESKFNSCRDDHVEMNMNQVSNYSFGEAEALTDEIEEASQTFDEVLRIKGILHNSENESHSVLYDCLRRLQLMALNVDTLKESEIGKAVNLLRKHASKEIRDLARTLIEGWKDLVDQWVNAKNSIAEVVPDYVSPYVLDEEDGLPFPPLDEAFLATQPTSIELSQFFDGMDDDGNPRNSGEFNKNHENGRKSTLEKTNIVRRKQQSANEMNILPKDKGQQMKKEEAIVKPNKPSKIESVHVRPPKQNAEQNVKYESKLHQKSDNVANQRRPPSSQQDKFKCSDEVSVQLKLEATKRKLQERYQQANDAKKQRTIQFMELRDIPKQGSGHKNSQVRPGNHNRHWANGRR